MRLGLESITKAVRKPGRGVQIGVMAGVVFLILMAIGAFALDAAHKDKIADGVSVGGVDVGGKTTDEASVQLQKNLVTPLKRPVKVTFEGNTYTLTPEQLEMHADIAGMVDEARDASREGALPSRLFRYATGGSVDRNISPRISYSNSALEGFIKGVEGKIDRDPVDAHVSPTPTSLVPEPPKDGVTVREADLRSKLQAAIQSPESRSVTPTVDRVKPQVTEDQLAAKYPSYIVIDRSGFRLRLFKNLKLASTYPIAVGQVGLETPAGLYDIQTKEVNPTWHVPDSSWAGDLAGTDVPPGPGNPLVARWMGIVDGAGIHGTDDIGSLGTAASHGCIRMAVPDVEALFDQVDIGTPVYVF
jgi:lipoprotein-anchoring transpeptidase ErfK/SrfK